VFNKTIIAVTAAVAVCCMPVATNVLAADHPGGGHGGGHALSRHAMGGHAGGGYARGGHGARNGGGYHGGAGPIYDTCDGYHGNGCPGFGVPYVGGLINGVLGGY
jgi:hypothetical protein